MCHIYLFESKRNWNWIDFLFFSCCCFFSIIIDSSLLTLRKHVKSKIINKKIHFNNEYKNCSLAKFYSTHSDSIWFESNMRCFGSKKKNRWFFHQPLDGRIFSDSQKKNTFEFAIPKIILHSNHQNKTEK